jgi:hypothetical protein
MKLICLSEHQVVHEGLLRKFEDEFGDVYEVSDDFGEELLTTGKFEQVVEEAVEEGG